MRGELGDVDELLQVEHRMSDVLPDKLAFHRVGDGDLMERGKLINHRLKPLPLFVCG